MSEQRVVRGTVQPGFDCHPETSTLVGLHERLPYPLDITALVHHSTGVGPLEEWMPPILETVRSILIERGVLDTGNLTKIATAMAKILGEEK